MTEKEKKEKEKVSTRTAILKALDELPFGERYCYRIASYSDKDVSQVHRMLKRMEENKELSSNNEVVNGKVYIIYSTNKEQPKEEETK